MGAKWDVLVDGRVAVVRRSWTGHIFYEATFEPVDGGRWWIGSAVTGTDDRRSRSPGAAYTIDEYHGVMLEWLISGIALGEADDELQYRVEAVIEQQHPAAEGLPRLILHTMLGLREIL